jgi:NAD(P)-dependent dehydrogenase (short-subunit alcohol dehydrogenase family)
MGASVGLLARRESPLQETAAEIVAGGGRASWAAASIRDEGALEPAIDALVDDLGGLDILVNNAGYHWDRGPEGLEGLQPEHVERVMRTNLHAVIWLCQAAVPHLQPGSAIINTTSIQAYDPSPALLDYAATKAALNNLTVNLAASLGPKGIRVNAVAPGPIWTPLQPATRDTSKIETFGADTPLGRAGQPGEVAPAYVFLASPADASYVSGTVLGVTGGGAVF